ncbi:MAG: hypothetical protein ACRDF5_00650 [bacterium]
MTKMLASFAVGGLALLLIGAPIPGPQTPVLGQAPPRVRWQITAEASARAEDRSRITLRGNGTFAPGRRDETTGGGTWSLTNASEEIAGSGTYTVTELLSWTEAPGGFGDTRAGLAALRIRYSDGGEGVLVVSCHLVGTPDSVFEGILASKGFVQFWNREINGTLFTLVRE